MSSADRFAGWRVCLLVLGPLLRGGSAPLVGLRTWRRGLGLVVAAAPGPASAYLAIVTVLSLVPLAQVWLTKLLVDHLQAAAAAGGAAATPLRLQVAVALAALYALALAVPAALGPLRVVVAATVEDRAQAAVDRRLMDAGRRLADLYRVERPAFHDELRLLNMASGKLVWAFAFLHHGPGTALTLAGVFLLLAQLHPLIPLVLAAVAVPHLLGERRLSELRFAVLASHSRAGREMDYCVRVLLEPAAAKEVRVFGLGDFFLGRFRRRHTRAVAEVAAMRLAHLRAASVFGVVHALALGGGFAYVAAQAGAGRLSLGDVALYLGAIGQAQARLAVLARWVANAYEALLHVRGLVAFLDRAGPAIALPAAGEGRQAPPALAAGVELRHVGFRYPDAARDTLEDLAAVLPAGTVTALVGHNGAGKSTLVKLLTRMYDPTAGEILLDGVPLRAYDLQSLRRRVAVVHQDFARFALTLGDNIAVGNITADALDAPAVGAANGTNEHAQMERAAVWSGADAVAAKLPQGYDTELTRRFEGGVDVSGGEWQKVALARSFMRDAALVILDEPTAALDADAEYRLFERFRELVTGKTALLISHRFSTVRMADYILVLEQGRIIEQGGHEQLVARGGRYATLFEMQAGRYR